MSDSKPFTCIMRAVVQPLTAPISLLLAGDHTQLYTRFVNMGRPQPRTNQQSTLKIEKCLLGDSDPSPSLRFSPVLPLGELPKRLGPQVEVSQGGL